MFLLLTPTAAESVAKVDITPDEFKAAFLAKVLTRITWPEDVFEGANADVIIGILGPDPFNGLLNKLVEGVKIGGRGVAVKVFPTPQAASRCHVLFVPASQQAGWVAWKTAAESGGASVGVLTVGESDDFLNSGGMIRLLSESRRFDVKPGNARRAHLVLDPKFLRAAQSIR